MSSDEARDAAAIAALQAAGALPVCTWTVRAGEALLAGGNAAFADLLGYTPEQLEEQVASGALTWRTLTGGDSPAPLGDEQVTAYAGHAVTREHELLDREGRRIPVVVATVPGPAEGTLVSLCLDVTEQAGARRDAEQASSAKSRFLGVMTHELRTPLNVINGQVALLREGVYGEPTEEQQQALERVERAERQLNGVIDEVLTFSRLETGRVAFELGEVHVAALLSEVVAAVQSQCTAKRQTIELHAPPEDVTVWADHFKLHEALLAIVSNATKFTPPEGRITIDTATRAEVPKFLFIRVTDTGAGIPHDHWESIFAPFTQVDERRARTAEGLGLGLTIARDLVRGMGGDVRVRSRGGQGATFTVAVRSSEADAAN